jgi:hypothetical protein
MLLMTGVLLSLGGFTYKFSRSASQAHLVILANELAVKRLDDMRQQPNYLSLFALNKTGRTVVADNRTFTESTYVLRTGGGVKDLTDYATITVVILNPAMTKRITKTSALAAF